MSNFTTIDLEAWPRKNTFDFFREFELPFFNINANVDVTNLKAHCDTHGYSFFLSSLYVAMKVANAIPEFRMRIREKSVIQYDTIRVGSTIQYEDSTFGFVYFPYTETLAEFNKAGEQRVNEALASKSFAPKDGDDDLIHLSVIPWINFTGLKHARRLGQEDSIPKIVFGKYVQQQGRLQMPVNVEVHHALVDGYHAGQYFEQFQEVIDAL